MLMIIIYQICNILIVKNNMITRFKIFEDIEDNNNELNSFVNSYGYNLEQIIKDVSNEYGDNKTGEEHTIWYLTELKYLYENGGEIYRIVFLKNINKLKKDKLGNHWTFDKEFQGVYGNIEDRSKQAYLLTAKVKPGDIDVDTSLGQFVVLPQETEIYIENGIPELINIKKYNR